MFPTGTAQRSSTKAEHAAQYSYVQTSILGGAPNANSEPTKNPNSWITIQNNRARLIPLGGAARYPVLVESDVGTRRFVYDSSPVTFDSNKIRVVPQTMARAFGMGAVQVGGGMLDANIVNALYPAPTQGVAGQAYVSGSILHSAGYVGGLFGVESGADLDQAPGLVAPFTYCAGYQQKLSTLAPSQSTPIPLPEFLNRGTAGTGSGGIGAIVCAFLGCGEGLIRHQFPHGSGWTDAHTLHKWYLDPISGGWSPGGDLVIGPGGSAAGSIAVIEETINLQTPTWLYLQLDVTDNGGDVLWTATIMRGGR